MLTKNKQTGVFVIHEQYLSCGQKKFCDFNLKFFRTSMIEKKTTKTTAHFAVMHKVFPKI